MKSYWSTVNTATMSANVADPIRPTRPPFVSISSFLSPPPNPVIEPDPIGEDDLRNPVAGDRAYDLWKVRQDSVLAELGALNQMSSGTGADLAKLDAMLARRLARGLASQTHLASGRGQCGASALEAR